MDGTLPLGYDARERKLMVNQEEARFVKHIFQRYLEFGSVRELNWDLDQRGIVSALKIFKGRARAVDGQSSSRRALYCLLSNLIYNRRARPQAPILSRAA
jgi:site-specific DNA recombinase